MTTWYNTISISQENRQGITTIAACHNSKISGISCWNISQAMSFPVLRHQSNSSSSNPCQTKDSEPEKKTNHAFIKSISPYDCRECRTLKKKKLVKVPNFSPLKRIPEQKATLNSMKTIQRQWLRGIRSLDTEQIVWFWAREKEGDLRVE